MEKALLVTIKIKSEKDSWLLEDSALELEELVSACGVEVVDNVTCVCEKPTSNLLIGKGKAEEIKIICQTEDVDAVIFSHDLSGTQQRNLEEVLAKKTIDRTQVILDIFSRRAKSPEGKMQVELAQLEYLFPRLVGKGIILSRLGGGIGTRGPGEQKLEVDRRRIRKRIEKLKSDLKDVSGHRMTLRKRRAELALPTVAIVGYTSAGKSTLLNALTQAGQTVSGSLFTTLDTIYKGMQLPDGQNIVISDTVGFLHNLPHYLIEAFKATLEEVLDADLLIHVLDASNSRVHEYNDSVIKVLKELGVEAKPMITALNKIDLLEDKLWLRHLEKDFEGAVPVSAKLGLNLDRLLKQIEEAFCARMEEVEVVIPQGRMDLVNTFYKEGKVKKITYQQNNIKAVLNLPKLLVKRLLHDKEIQIRGVDKL